MSTQCLWLRTIGRNTYTIMYNDEMSYEDFIKIVTDAVGTNNYKLRVIYPGEEPNFLDESNFFPKKFGSLCTGFMRIIFLS